MGFSQFFSADSTATVSCMGLMHYHMTIVMAADVPTYMQAGMGTMPRVLFTACALVRLISTSWERQ